MEEFRQVSGLRLQERAKLKQVLHLVVRILFRKTDLVQLYLPHFHFSSPLLQLFQVVCFLLRTHIF